MAGVEPACNHLPFLHFIRVRGYMPIYSERPHPDSNWDNRCCRPTDSHSPIRPKYVGRLPTSGRLYLSSSAFYGQRFLSERRNSNPRHLPWQGSILPTELLSHFDGVGEFSDNTFHRCAAGIPTARASEVSRTPVI